MIAEFLMKAFFSCLFNIVSSSYYRASGPSKFERRLICEISSKPSPKGYGLLSYIYFTLCLGLMSLELTIDAK